MGAAILDYQTKGKAGKLSILSSMFEEDEMPVKHLFRNLEEMPMLEQKALTHIWEAKAEWEAKIDCRMKADHKARVALIPFFS